MNTIAGEWYAKQLQVKRDAEQAKRAQVERERIMMLESDAHDEYLSAALTVGETKANFEEKWPGLWETIKQERMLALVNAPKSGPAVNAF